MQRSVVTMVVSASVWAMPQDVGELNKRRKDQESYDRVSRCVMLVGDWGRVTDVVSKQVEAAMLESVSTAAYCERYISWVGKGWHCHMDLI